MNFGELPLAVRDRMFGYFSTLFTWDPSLDAQVRAAWEVKLPDRMRDDVFKARIKIITQKHDWHETVPWISEDVGYLLIERLASSHGDTGTGSSKYNPALLPLILAT